MSGTVIRVVIPARSLRYPAQNQEHTVSAFFLFVPFDMQDRDFDTSKAGNKGQESWALGVKRGIKNLAGVSYSEETAVVVKIIVAIGIRVVVKIVDKQRPPQ